MTETPKKPGFFKRLFGRKDPEPVQEALQEPVQELLPPPQGTPVPGAPQPEPDRPEETAATAAPETPETIAPAQDIAAPTEPVAAPELPVAIAADHGPPHEVAQVPSPISQAAPAAPAPKKKWWARLKDGLKRTSSTIGQRVGDLFTKRKLDAATLEELEDVLIQADLGVDTAARVTAALAKGRFDKEIEADEVKAVLAAEIEAVLAPVAKPLMIPASASPFVIMVVGVNGSGKTTTIGKLAAKFRAEGRTVMLAAGDTFRAAAIDQLKVWGERTGTPVVARDQGADSAGLAFDALKAAKEAHTDVLILDTAGRLQNKAELMAELEKVTRVMKKQDPAAPHAVLLVLDATTGQNALGQVEAFGRTAGVTGLVMTKLDGTARGGILVAVAARFGLPVHFIGVGEGVDDLEPFTASDFARAIVGLEQGS